MTGHCSCFLSSLAVAPHINDSNSLRFKEMLVKPSQKQTGEKKYCASLTVVDLTVAQAVAREIECKLTVQTHTQWETGAESHSCPNFRSSFLFV